MDVFRFPGRPVPRWSAIVTYRTELGLSHRLLELEEISDLHEGVEGGPHWDTIVGITVHRINHNENPALTIEQAAKL